MSDSCSGACDRRDFLKGAATLVALSAIFGTDLAAMPMAFGTATGRAGGSVSYPLPTADGVTVDRDNDVVLARVRNQVYAFSLTCPHQNTALRWQESRGEFQCPKHRSRYRPDGTFIAGRATRAMDRYAIVREGGGVAVDVTRLFRADDQPSEWAAAVVAV